ncbi:phage tail protein I [Prosthecodimorpha staleyi]|nr:phage tail protein I [Prosthecodimorpha staleyi]
MAEGASAAGRHTGFDLLPPSAMAVERALSLVSAEARDAIPWDDLAACFDPARCAERLLPWLATVYSVDLWIETWPTTRKREVIARAIELHRLKGTLAGIEAYLGLVDARIVAVRTPPDLFFLDEEDGFGRAAWLARLPEIQIRHWMRRGSADQAGALDDPAEGIADGEVSMGPLEVFLDDDEPDVTIGALFCLEAEDQPLTGAEAVLIVAGRETPLVIEPLGEDGSRSGIIADVERLHVPQPSDPYWFLALDDAAGDPDPGFIGDEDGCAFLASTDRTYAALIRRGRQTFADFAGPTVIGRDVLDVDPVRLYPESPAPATWFLDECAGDLIDGLGSAEPLGYLADETEVLTAYVDSWRLVDPDVPETHGPAFSFLGVDRLGIPAYEAELTVDRLEPSHPLGLFLGDVPGDDDALGYLIEDEFAALAEICAAIDTAKSRRDRVLIDANHRSAKSLREMTSIRDLFA